jgi:flagellin
MALLINTNQSSLNAQRKLSGTSHALSTSFERLSSGLRINGAKDDAAGLSITTRFSAQVNGLNQAVRNSNDGVSLAQTTEGALNETTHILQRMRELAVQSANDTNNSNDRASIQAEVAQLKEEIDRIADTTNFNGNKVLDGNFLMRDLQVGANVGETISVNIDGAATTDLARQARYESQAGFVGAFALGNNLDITGELGSATIRGTVASDDQVSSSSNASSAIAKATVINASSDSTGVRAIVGKSEITFGSSVAGIILDGDDFLIVNDEKLSGFTVEQNDASGALIDAINAVSNETGVVGSLNSDGELVLTANDGRNIRVEFSGFGTGLGLGNDAGTSGVVLNAANNLLGTGDLSLQSNDVFEIEDGGNAIGFTNGLYGVNSDFSVNSIDLSSREESVIALDIIDLALEDVSAQRADLGALQNRLESTINNLNTTSENLSAARSRILDADFASETAQLSKNQIIQQAGVSILAQANQQPQIALSLLG